MWLRLFILEVTSSNLFLITVFRDQNIYSFFQCKRVLVSELYTIYFYSTSVWITKIPTKNSVSPFVGSLAAAEPIQKLYKPSTLQC